MSKTFHRALLADYFGLSEKEMKDIGMTVVAWGFGERVDTFFSSRMWHHAGRPTTGHCTETIEINTTSHQETDHYTQTSDKYKIKA